MKTFCRTLMVSALALSISGIPLMAQDHHDDQSNHDRNSQRNDDQYNRDHRSDRGNGQQYDHHDNDRYVHHREWRRGSHINHDDWNRGSEVDWHSRHLRQPPRGYEWREVDGNYVLAAVATGIIASVIIASHSH